MITIKMPSEIQADLASAFSKARKARKHSRAAAAKLTGVPYATIRRFEDIGEISLKQFLMLVAVYGDLQAATDLFCPVDPAAPKTMDELIRRSQGR